MPFDLDAFEAAQFAPRTDSVSVPALAEFFPDGEDPIFEVRGLNSNELNKADSAAKTQRTLGSVAEAVAQGGRKQVAEIRKAMGLGDATPAEVAKRQEMLVAGCISPPISLPIAAKIAENFPIEFLLVTNKISELTGQGASLVKPEAASQPMAS